MKQVVFTLCHLQKCFSLRLGCGGGGDKEENAFVVCMEVARLSYVSDWNYGFICVKKCTSD